MSIGGDLLMAHAEIAEKIVRESEMKKEIALLRARVAELEAVILELVVGWERYCKNEKEK